MGDSGSMVSHSFLLCILLSFLLSVHGISAMYTPKFIVTNLAPNHPGGVKFEKLLGIPYTKKLLDKIHKFVVTTVFEQTSPPDQRTHENNSVLVNIVDIPEGAAGTAWGGNRINASAKYLDWWKADGKKDLKWAFELMMYHEVTHLLHWDGEGTMPIMLNEGFADYTQLKANFADENTAKLGYGDKWDQGYIVTARFYEYCDSVSKGFVAKLNRMSRKTYNVKYFKDITGKPVEQLWKEYKAKYGKKDINT